MKTLILTLLVLFLLITFTLSQDTDADQRAQVIRDNSELIKKWTERRLKTLTKVEAEAELEAAANAPELVPEIAVQTVAVPADAEVVATEAPAVAPVETAKVSKKDALKSKIRLALEKRLKDKSTDAPKVSRDELKARIRNIIRRKLTKGRKNKTSTKGRKNKSSTKDRVRKLLGGKRRRSIKKSLKKVGRKGSKKFPRRFSRKGGRKGSKKFPRRRHFGRRGKRVAKKEATTDEDMFRIRRPRFDPRKLCKACKYCDKLKRPELVARCNDVCERRCTKPAEVSNEDVSFANYLRKGIHRYIASNDEYDPELSVSASYNKGPWSVSGTHDFQTRNGNIQGAYNRGPWNIGAQHSWDDDMDLLKLKKLAKKGLKAYQTYQKYRGMIPLDDDEFELDFDPEWTVTGTYTNGPFSVSGSHTWDD